MQHLRICHNSSKFLGFRKKTDEDLLSVFKSRSTEHLEVLDYILRLHVSTNPEKSFPKDMFANKLSNGIYRFSDKTKNLQKTPFLGKGEGTVSSPNVTPL